MGIVTVFLIAVSLAMDAFAVSVSNGIAMKNFRVSDGVKMGTFFGVFQCMMPLLGWVLGNSVRVYIEAVDHWIAFILLLLIGGNMVKESLSKDCDEDISKCDFALTNKKLILQAIATSIDALAVGISFAMLNVDIISAAIIIGLVCFVISFVGGSLGKKLGEVFEERAEFLGGIVLIVIGAKILAEHLIF
ncbi:MAG: manganese efflux pump MntP family protein [Lachnospiraceae bacterium]|nr:manganese efflux pump MntP family protein [Lachnospiraceae bacterium]